MILLPHYIDGRIFGKHYMFVSCLLYLFYIYHICIFTALDLAYSDVALLSQFMLVGTAKGRRAD